MNGENLIVTEGDKTYTYLPEGGQALPLRLESPTPKLLSEANFPSGVEATLQNAQDIVEKRVNLVKDFRVYLYRLDNMTITQEFSVPVP